MTGWHTGFPDARYRLVAASERVLADDGTPYFIGEFAGADGGDHPVCPRTLLRRVIDRAGLSGLKPQAGFEYEFFVFREDSISVREKGYRGLQAVTPGNFGYSVLRAATNADIFTALMDYCAAFRMPLEGLHCETGPGVWEAALAIADGLEAADRAVLFKTFSKAFFGQRGHIATFMAKWSMDYPGQSGHYHFSMLDEAGRNAFAGASASASADASAGADVPDRARWALGGLVHYVPEFLCLLAPTVNSYTRLVKGALGADGLDLGRGQPHGGLPFHSRRRQGPAHRVPRRRRRRQSLPCRSGCPRRGPARHRGPHRAAGSRGRQCLRR